jgi:hypothetical protein
MPATKEKPLDLPTWIARQQQPTVRRSGVGPRTGQGPEASALAGHGIEHVEQVPRRAGEPYSLQAMKLA